MDDNREGCFPESYVHPADAASTDETAMPQPLVDKGRMSTMQASLVLSFLLTVAIIVCLLSCLIVFCCYRQICCYIVIRLVAAPHWQCFFCILCVINSAFVLICLAAIV